MQEMRDIRDACRIFVEESEANRPLGRLVTHGSILQQGIISDFFLLCKELIWRCPIAKSFVDF
jgi:hypothetical protein